MAVKNVKASGNLQQSPITLSKNNINTPMTQQNQNIGLPIRPTSSNNVVGGLRKKDKPTLINSSQQNTAVIEGFET